MFCSGCGVEVKQGDKFCPQCGMEVVAATAQAVGTSQTVGVPVPLDPSPSSRPHNTTGRIIGGVVLLLIGLVELSNVIEDLANFNPNTAVNLVVALIVTIPLIIGGVLLMSRPPKKRSRT